MDVCSYCSLLPEIFDVRQDFVEPANIGIPMLPVWSRRSNNYRIVMKRMPR